MPYITSAERFGMKKGALQAKREDVLVALRIRFRAVPGSIEESISRIEDLDGLKRLLEHAITTGSIEEFEQALSP